MALQTVSKVLANRRILSCRDLYLCSMSSLLPCNIDQRNFNNMCRMIHLGNSPKTTSFKMFSSPSKTLMHILQKRYKSQRKGERKQTDDSDSDSDESDHEYPEDIHFEADRHLPNNFTERKVTAASLRVDVLLSKGLNVGRNKVDEYFLDSKLRLNGNRLLKKSVSLKEGDAIDWIKSQRDGITNFGRVRLVLVSENTTRKGSLIVYLRIWKSVSEEDC